MGSIKRVVAALSVAVVVALGLSACGDAGLEPRTLDSKYHADKLKSPGCDEGSTCDAETGWRKLYRQDAPSAIASTLTVSMVPYITDNSGAFVGGNEAVALGQALDVLASEPTADQRACYNEAALLNLDFTGTLKSGDVAVSRFIRLTTALDRQAVKYGSVTTKVLNKVVPPLYKKDRDFFRDVVSRTGHDLSQNTSGPLQWLSDCYNLSPVAAPSTTPSADTLSIDPDGYYGSMLSQYIGTFTPLTYHVSDGGQVSASGVNTSYLGSYYPLLRSLALHESEGVPDPESAEFRAAECIDTATALYRQTHPTTESMLPEDGDEYNMLYRAAFRSAEAWKEQTYERAAGSTVKRAVADSPASVLTGGNRVKPEPNMSGKTVEDDLAQCSADAKADGLDLASFVGRD